MINVDEHKKLLEQIKELEKNSINYFDVEKEFFLIDSNNLSQVRPRLYGYSIQRDGIYEDDNLTPEAIANLDGRGCYVYVDVKDGQITIKQDLNGCWGIYLFRHGDYFALSNSFFRLIDHIKFKYPLTVNRDYCHYLLVNGLCSHAYSETAVNEIQLVDRSAIINIDVKGKSLHLELIDYKEHTISPDSQEGIDTLDRWFEFWGDVFRGLQQHTKSIRMDLSGGFDTRIVFLLAVHSGMDIKNISINTFKGTHHTYKEDYDIASRIAEHYGLTLNQPLPDYQYFEHSFSDIFNINCYVNMLFSKIPRAFSIKRVNKLYSISGFAGETIRHYWHELPDNFLKKEFQKTYSSYSYAISPELNHSIEVIINSAYHSICNKHNITDKLSKDIPQFLYQETRCRNHFGKCMLISYLTNDVNLSPIIDPELQTLQLYVPKCPDPNLLMALIFTRYEPDLLTFPFDSRRSINRETIEYAQKINERFPHRVKDVAKATRGGVFYLQPLDSQAKKIFKLGKGNQNISSNFFNNLLKATFESSKTYSLFTGCFNEELYHFAASYCATHSTFQYRPLYPIIGISRVLEDVEISQRNHLLYRDMQRLLEQDFVTIHNDNNISPEFIPYISARIDIIKLNKKDDFQIIYVSDEKATVRKPVWLQKNGTGYVVCSCTGNLYFIVKADLSGKIQLFLRGFDVRDPSDKSKRIPYWIDYKTLKINENVIFNELTPSWCHKPYIYNIDVKAGEEIKIQVEWLPHRSDT